MLGINDYVCVMEEQYNTIICTSADEMKEVKRLLDERGFEPCDGSGYYYDLYIENFTPYNIFITFKDDWHCGNNDAGINFTNKISFSKFMKKQDPPEKWWMRLKEGDEVQCSYIEGKRPNTEKIYGGTLWEKDKIFIVLEVHDYSDYGIVFDNSGTGVFTNSLIPIYSQQIKKQNGKTIKVQRQSLQVRRGETKRGKSVATGRPARTIRGRYQGNLPQV